MGKRVGGDDATDRSDRGRDNGVVAAPAAGKWRGDVERAGAPYAFLIPADQGDRARVAAMVHVLLGQHIEVGRATGEVRLKEGTFPAGTYVVKLAQPYRNYALDLLGPQDYPKDGNEPYDDVSWELPANYKLQAVATADESVKLAPLTLLNQAPQPEGHVQGAGPVFLMKDTGQEELLAARYRLAQFRIEIAEHSFSARGAEFPAGSWILPAQSGLADAVHRVARELGLDFTSVASEPDTRRHADRAARIGLWVPWADTDSIGWIRYVLDQRKVPYTYLRDEDIRAGAWRDQIDVLLYGHVDLELAEQIHGLPKRWGPMPFKKTPQTPSFGTPAESDDITGGIGWEGLQQIQTFVESGGLMVTLGNAARRAEGRLRQRRHRMRPPVHRARTSG